MSNKNSVTFNNTTLGDMTKEQLLNLVSTMVEAQGGLKAGDINQMFSSETRKDLKVMVVNLGRYREDGSNLPMEEVVEVWTTADNRLVMFQFDLRSVVNGTPYFLRHDEPANALQSAKDAWPEIVEEMKNNLLTFAKEEGNK